MFALLVQIENSNSQIKHLVCKEQNQLVVKDLLNERFEYLFDFWIQYYNIYLYDVKNGVSALVVEKDKGKYQVIENRDTKNGVGQFLNWVQEKSNIL